MRISAWVVMMFLLSAVFDFDKKFTGQVLEAHDYFSWFLAILLIAGLVVCVLQDIREITRGDL